MNWDRIEGNWKQLKGRVREKWGKLSDDHIDVVAGKRDKLIGRIQEAYGVTRDEANRQIDEFTRAMHDEVDDEPKKPLRH